MVPGGPQWGYGLASERPPFTGHVEHGLDDKGRLVVPARFRERLGAGFFLTIIEPDQCLGLYPAPAYAELCARIDAAPVKDAEHRDFARRFSANSEELSCDSQGRLVIPNALRAFAKIERDVVSIGAITRVEIWARELYAAQEKRATQSKRDFATELGLY